MSKHTQTGSKSPELKRSITLPLLSFYGLGTIIGAGIYVLVGEVAVVAGYQAPVAFLLAAVVAGFTAFTYAELVSRYPKSAGEAVYVQAAFGRKPLAACIGWAIVSIGIVSSATIVNGFVGYLQVFVQLPDALIVVAVVLILAGTAAWGISQSVWLASVITLLELGGLLYIIWVALPAVSDLPEKAHLLLQPRWDVVSIQGTLLGAFLAFYAFIGFEDMVNVAEEVKSPRITIPRAIIIALVVSTLLYVSVSLLAVLSLSPESFAHTDAPLTQVAMVYSDNAGLVISAVSLVAVINGALIQTIMASRVLYGMGKQGMGPRRFARVNPYTRTPLQATVLVGVLILLFALSLPLVALATVTSFITLLVFSTMHLALIRIKSKNIQAQQAASPEHVIYPLWVPVLGLLLNVILLLFQTWQVCT